jgi:hypothetical protein
VRWGGTMRRGGVVMLGLRLGEGHSGAQRHGDRCNERQGCFRMHDVFLVLDFQTISCHASTVACVPTG